MKANLTYSIISAELKQGMYLLVNDHLGYISRMNAEKAIISFYYEDGKVIKLGKQEMTREDAISTYSTSVIKLIAIVDGNPVSINHLRKVQMNLIFLNLLRLKNGIILFMVIFLLFILC